MPRRRRVHLPDMPLHIVQRGHNRDACFFGEDDYVSYRHWLSEALKETGCALHAVTALTGVFVGWSLMQRISDTTFKPLVGTIILILTVLQLVRLYRPDLYERVPHQLWFAWFMGLLAGVTTMLANAAGPIMALFLIAVALPKFELVGTSAWFFLIINCLKVPFSVQLGLIHPSTLTFNAILIPAVASGLFTGRWCVTRISQRIFDALLLAFVAIAALRLIGLF